WLENGIANLKTEKQKMAIELADQKKRLKRREEYMKGVKKLDRSKLFMNTVYKNGKGTFVKISEITEEMKEKEIEHGILINK
ncbi:MAG: hypothetical protein GY828_03995, partial [Candidatus Gracilibacteria bacterium]|nr:hypothetical protein [Candidatus Gracilibacteria bacterium]